MVTMFKDLESEFKTYIVKVKKLIAKTDPYTAGLLRRDLIEQLKELDEYIQKEIKEEI